MCKASRVVTTCLIGVGAVSISAARAADADGEGWRFELTPYLFAAGLDGTSGARGVEADVEMDVDDILDQLEFGLMGTLELRRGRWGVLFDGLYFELAAEAARSWHGPGGIGSATGVLDVTSKMQMYQLSAGYRVGERVAVDLLGGARYTRLDLISI